MFAPCVISLSLCLLGDRVSADHDALAELLDARINEGLHLGGDDGLHVAGDAVVLHLADAEDHREALRQALDALVRDVGTVLASAPEGAARRVAALGMPDHNPLEPDVRHHLRTGSNTQGLSLGARAAAARRGPTHAISPV